MTRVRMMTNDEPAEAEAPSPRTTIVGGQPEKNLGPLPPVPTGVQTLLRMAALDATFLDTLVEQRADVAEAAGVQLTRSEAAMLAAIPEVQLRQFARTMPPPDPKRRDVLRQTAASAVVLLGGAAMAETLTGCCDAVDRVTNMGMATGGGAAPDWPEEDTTDRPDHMEYETGGAAPDWPDEPTPGDDDSADDPTPEPPTPEPPTPEEEPPIDPPPPVSRGHRADMPPPGKPR